jgi:putative nucleotidyltransferase with HDIG domain
MSSLPSAEPEQLRRRGASRLLRYLPHVLVATGVVCVVPIAIVWALREWGAVSSPWVAVPLAVALSLLAAVLGSAWWSRRRRADDLLFSELLLWGWLRRIYIDHQVDRAVEQLCRADPLDQPGRGDMTVKRRTRLLTQLAAALESQDPYLEGHSRRVARHATMIARKIGLDHDQVATIRKAAVLHDVGKLRVPQALLNKPGRLSVTEFDQIKPHAAEGAKMVAGLGDDQLALIVRHHHERLDGTGYPDALRGAYIPLGARVIAVADMYDAITAARPYRPAAPHKQALDTLREESLTHLDPALVRAFRSCYSRKGPLAFWESLAAWTAAAHLFPRSPPATATRISLRGVAATTLAATIVAVVAISAPIGMRAREHHPAAPPRGPSIALTPSHAIQSTTGNGRKRPTPVHAMRSAHIVVHRPPPSTGAALATPQLTQTPTTRRGAQPGLGQTPSTPVTTGPTPPSTQRPTTTTHQPPPKPHPRPTLPRPPTTTVNPPQTTSTTPGSGTPTTTTTPSSAPTTTPAPPPVTSTPVYPASKDACKKGGYVQYGFRNQGQCIAAVEHRR